MTDLPIACTLQDAERQRRRSEVLDRVFARAEEKQPRDHGYALRFAADDALLADLVQIIALERQCCGFLRFCLTVEPEGGPVWLELTGPDDGTKAFLESELGLASGQPQAGPGE